MRRLRAVTLSIALDELVTMRKLLLATFTLACAATVLRAGEAAEEASPPLDPVPVRNGAADLDPATARITFVGLHEGDDPNPRLGGFGKFIGRAEVDATGKLKAVTLDIDTASLWTEIPRLTAHLKGPDFFSVREHPAATFRSTSITSTDEVGRYAVQGELTLLGVTKSLKIPVTANVNEQGLTLASQFVFDRREFGMDYGQGQIKNEVTVEVRVGEPTQRPDSKASPRR